MPVHTAHDRASLEDLLDLLAGQEDGADRHRRHGAARRPHPRAARHAGAPLDPEAAGRQRRRAGRDDRGRAGRLPARSCAGVVLSKMDEAVKLGPALDALIRHKLKVVGVANGQRVPEDWHRLSANALVQRALRGGGGSAYRLDASDVNLSSRALAPRRCAARRAARLSASNHA